uniref:C2H2-type domain-containing protein n=1 Tax=Erpetoichthys calabaricus TaxID=27687 RepID=A0A8C4TC64_ERPCA
MACQEVDFIEQQGISVKEEHFEWQSYPPVQDGFCIKQEDQATDIKNEDSEQGPFFIKREHACLGLERQIHGTVNAEQIVTAQNDCNIQMWPEVKKEARGVGFIQKRQMSPQKHSALVKHELFETEDTCCRSQEEGQLYLQENMSCTLPSVAQASLQYMAQENDNILKDFTLTSGKIQSPIPQYSSLSVEKPIQLDSIKPRKWKRSAKPVAYICQECGKSFKRKSNCNEHQRIHTGERPYCCSECDKRFTDRSHLQRHKKIHTGEKPHCCTECGKCFSRKGSLQKHTIIHTGEKPYSCSECGKQFIEKRQLLTHRRIHTGEELSCCSECGKQFIARQQLQRHKRIHTGEKPYCCAECGKRFSQLSNLYIHKRIHTGEKPHGCFECGKRFSQLSNLKTHTKIHFGEKTHCCPECGKHFLHASALQKHTRIHKGETSQQ